MHRRWFRSPASWAALILTPHLLGPAQAAAQETLTWADVAAALDRHPLCLAAGSALAAAEGEAAAAGAYPNPEIGVGLGTARALEGDDSRDVWEIEVTLPLLSPLVYRGAARAAGAERDAAADEARARRLEARAQMRTLFLGLAHGQERLRVLAQSRRQMERLAEVARLRVQHGEARPIEAQQFGIELARIELACEEAALTRAADLQTMNAWLGGRLPPGVRVEAEFGTLPEVPPLEAALTAARDRHPDLQAAAQRVRSASARLEAERWARWPEISASGFYESELDAESYGVRLAMALPVWNWNGGAIAQAQARREEARWLHALAEQELAAAVRTAHAQAGAALARARRYQQEILAASTAASSALERMYQVGEADALEVLAAGRETNEIEAELWDAVLQAHLAALELETLTGGVGDDEDARNR